MHTNLVTDCTEFTYYMQERIVSEYVNNAGQKEEDGYIQQHWHEYDDEGNETIFYLNNSEGENDFFFCITYDDKKRKIDEKITIKESGELMSWIKEEFDDVNNKCKWIELNANGEIEYVSESTINGRECKTELNANQERLFKDAKIYNEKGHWLNHIEMNDGEPRNFYDRPMEYY